MDSPAETPPNSIQPGTVVGPYTITRKIGAGGMGEVYLASESKLNRRVALKVIIPGKEGEGDMVKRFQAEGRALASINHKNVVSVFAVDQIDQFHYIAMEYVEGRSLNDLCLNIVWPANEAAPIFLQMLEGVQALHEKNIIHRDLKPHNIIYEKSSVVKIIDLGIAKVFNDVNVTSHTVTGMMVGTLQYMAPEVVRGGTATALADIWSLGAIFYQMLMGTPLIKGSNHVEYFASHANMRVAFPPAIAPHIPAEMQTIVSKMCSKETAMRYKSIAEIIVDLKKYEEMFPNQGQWIYNNYARDIKNLSSVKQKLLAAGRSEFTTKQVIFQALIENSMNKLADVDPDKTVDFKAEGAEEITDKSLTVAISKVTAIMPIKRMQEKRSNFSAIAGAVAVLVLLAGGYWYWDNNKPAPAPVVIAPSPRPAVAANPAPTTPAPAEVKPEEPARAMVTGRMPLPKKNSDDEMAEQILAETKQAKAAPIVPPPVAVAAPKKVEPKEVPLVAPKIEAAELKLVLIAQPSADGRGPSAQVEVKNPPTFEWEKIPRNREYNFQIAGDQGFDKPVVDEVLEANFFQWAAAKPGNYRWRVQSVDNKGRKSPFSETGSINMTVEPTHLPADSRNEVSVVSPGALAAQPAMIPVKWPPSVFAHGYEVAISSDSSFNSIDMTTNVKVPEAKIGFTDSGTKFIRVTVVDNKGRSISSASNVMRIEVKAVQSIPAPNIVAPPANAKLMVKGKPGPVLLVWSKVDKVETYEMQLSNRQDFSSLVFSKSQKANQLVLKQVLPEGVIYWRIRANTPSSQSAWSTGQFEVR